MGSRAPSARMVLAAGVGFVLLFLAQGLMFIRARMGRAELVVPELRKALRLDPSNAEAARLLMGLSGEPSRPRLP